MSTRDIVATFKEMYMYSADISPVLIAKVTDRVIDRCLEWQNRSLDANYPIVYLDCIVLKIRQNQRVINKSLYLAINEASKKWNMPIRNWKLLLNLFSVGFGGRFTDHL